MTKEGRVYVIAEIGINHNGSLDNCFKLIDAAATAGCDAVKFQLFKAATLYPKSAGNLDWQDGAIKYDYNIYSAAREFELSEDWIDGLMSRAKERGVDWLCSAFDPAGIDFLVATGLSKIKLSSYALTNLPLIDHAAKTGLPITMSTGGATLGEVEEAVVAVRKHHDRLALLHCSISYPTALKDCNLGVLETFKLAFPGIAVGWSDHTQEIADSAKQAVYLGATVIEKHITLDKKMPGPDHFFALEPADLKRLVDEIRVAEIDHRRGVFTINKTIYGQTAKITYEQESYLRDFAFMKLFSKREIRKGDTIAPGDIAILRPGKKDPGLDPKYIQLFADHTITAKKDIAAEAPITWDAILS